MIGFFIKSGGMESNGEFRLFVWGKDGIGYHLDAFLANRVYGSEVKFILIKFYVEGNLPMWLPKKIKSAYSQKEKALSVEVPVLKEFFAKSEEERCHFIVESVVNSLNAVRKLCERHQLDLDLDSLVHDVVKVGKSWLETRQAA